MPHSSEAEDHLRIIRSLMEKATIYRAISAQAALIGGLLALVAGAFMAGTNDVFIDTLISLNVHPANAWIYGFQLKWIVVLLICVAANFHFLRRDAGRRQEPFLSAGMRMALGAMIPVLLSAAVVTSFCSREMLPQMWMMFYGLALLSTAHFAPGSIVRLGWAFLLTGLILFLINAKAAVGIAEQIATSDSGSKGAPGWTYTDLLMAIVFGGYHLIYAACTLRRAPAAEPVSAA
jgi:hypothetical protein